jgi:long-chain acyl-CoA synthetase
VTIQDDVSAHSVQAAVRSAAGTFGHRPAVGLPGALQSFAQTYERVLRLASALEGVGVGPGGRVGILASNGPWYFELYFAVCEAGMVETPLNLRLTLSELTRYADRIRPEIVLVTADHVARARSLQANVPSIRHLIGIGDGHGLEFDYERLLAAAKPYERPLRATNELVLLAPTSGTSGEAKAVIHTQSTTAAGYGPLVDTFEIGPDCHVVTGLAMHFASAYAGWTMSFAAGAQHTIMPTFDPAGWVDLVEQVGGTHGFLAPTAVYMIMDGRIDLQRLRVLRYLSLGGAPCDHTRLRALTDALGERLAIQFGMTELGAATVLLGKEFVGADGTLSPRHRSIGRPVRGVEVRLVADNGAVLEPGSGQPGELEFRGAVVSAGYLEDPEATAASRSGRWFRSGDVATIDEAGFAYIVDRKKDLIVSGGINIAPLEVEHVIGSHPAVSAVGVFGVTDRTYGEAVHAAVVVAPGASVSEEELIAWCRDRLASVKKPRSISFVDSLPISSTGKLLRRELRASFATPPRP